MGWLFTSGQSRAALIQRLTRTVDTEIALYTTLAHCVRGNVLWTVRETTFHVPQHGYLPGFPIRYIGCDLMAGGRGTDWGYKDLDERSHPYYYHCPLAYLDRVPEANPEWRAEVRAWHARNSQVVHVGEVWHLLPHFTIKTVEIVSLRPLRARGIPNGVYYRIKRQYLDHRRDETPAPEVATQLELISMAA